jgi:hypothetical protein
MPANSTKSELNEIIENLELRLKAHDSRQDYKDRELARYARLFIQLYEDKNTIDMRFSWLETASTDVVNACGVHRMGLIETLADELGIEFKKD